VGSDWLADLLLESVAPPPVWMGSRAERLADAHLTLRRRFGLQRETGARASRRLRDFGSAHPLVGGTRIVPGDEIEAELELEITTVNPPVAQGWIVATGAILLIVELFTLRQIVADPLHPIPLSTFAIFFGAPLLWLAAIGVVGWFEHEIELTESGVVVRRWTDRWLRRSARTVGPPAEVKAWLESPFELALSGASATVEVSLWLWPQTARQDLVDELPIWGIDCEFDRHRHRHDRPGRRRRAQHRRDARLARLAGEETRAG
jgi:hypothetical protein